MRQLRCQIEPHSLPAKHVCRFMLLALCLGQNFASDLICQSSTIFMKMRFFISLHTGLKSSDKIRVSHHEADFKVRSECHEVNLEKRKSCIIMCTSFQNKRKANYILNQHYYSFHLLFYAFTWQTYCSF